MILPGIFLRLPAIGAVMLSLVVAAELPLSHVGAAGAPPVPVQDNRMLPLYGSVAPGLAHARRLTLLRPARSLAISVALRPRDPAGLQRFLRDVYDPRSPLYRHFLSPAQFAARFGVTEAERRAIDAWLETSGMRVDRWSRNGLLVTARGRVGRIDRALATSIYLYRRGHRTFYANASPVHVPAALTARIAAVAGLTGDRAVQPAVSRPRAAARSLLDGVAPSTLARLYDLQSLYDAGINGSGQTIAVVSQADYNQDNVSVYDQRFGFTSAVERVRVNDGNTTGAPLGNGQDETEADIETVQSIAPKAHVLVYEAENTDAGAIANFTQIVSDRRARVVTTSWGNYEAAISRADLAALDGLLAEAAAQGQTVVAASGDAGAYDQAGGDPPGDPHKLAVDFPASDPWVTGVGGTTLEGNGQAYGGEIAWSDGSDPSNPAGSGGGLSDVFSRPAYQAGPGVLNRYSNGMRQVPDVAADADVNTGLMVYVFTDGQARWAIFGGTSVAAPIWAGYLALVNQDAGHPIGFANPVLYAIGQKPASSGASPFHDVTQGTNLYYPATPGWDFATGWGSFDGAALAGAILASGLSSSPTPTATATPVRKASATPTVTPTVTPRPTSTPTARPSATPTATRTPAVAPALSIAGTGILHQAGGHLTPTASIRLGEKATFVVYFALAHGGAHALTGHLVIMRKHRLVGTFALGQVTLGKRRGLGKTLVFPRSVGSGPLTAQFVLKLGRVTVSRSQSFVIVSR